MDLRVPLSMVMKTSPASGWTEARVASTSALAYCIAEYQVADSPGSSQNVSSVDHSFKFGYCKLLPLVSVKDGMLRRWLDSDRGW